MNFCTEIGTHNKYLPSPMTRPQDPSLVWLRPASPSSSSPTPLSSEMSEWDICSQSDFDHDAPDLECQSDDDSDNEDSVPHHKTDQTVGSSEDLPLKLGLKYKKVKDEVQPVCKLIPEHQKTRRHFPEERRLLQHVLLVNQRSIAFDEDER